MKELFNVEMSYVESLQFLMTVRRMHRYALVRLLHLLNLYYGLWLKSKIDWFQFF